LRSADVLHAGGIRGFVGVIAHIETAIVIETAIEREIVATPTGRACLGSPYMRRHSHLPYDRYAPYAIGNLERILKESFGSPSFSAGVVVSIEGIGGIGVIERLAFGPMPPMVPMLLATVGKFRLACAASRSQFPTCRPVVGR
jgi:hypothetical protein